jgi:hypothetical protein
MSTRRSQLNDLFGANLGGFYGRILVDDLVAFLSAIEKCALASSCACARMRSCWTSTAAIF